MESLAGKMNTSRIDTAMAIYGDVPESRRGEFAGAHLDINGNPCKSLGQDNPFINTDIDDAILVELVDGPERVAMTVEEAIEMFKSAWQIPAEMRED